MICFLYLMLFALIFSGVQALVMRRFKTTPYNEAVRKLGLVKNLGGIQKWIVSRQIMLKRKGADIFIKDGISVSDWYLYKLVFSCAGLLTGSFICRLKGDNSLRGSVCVIAVAVASWFVLDIYISIENKTSNESMMPDIVDMSRSVLYGKRGGQFITDALKDAVIVVEDKRLKTALLKLNSNLDSGKSIDEALEELEMSFTSAEIGAFCTVIRSLQTTGQVDEALKTLETNIQRAQTTVNKKRCVVVENKTMMYVMLIAFDILAVILYCIICKLMEMEIAF